MRPLDGCFIVDFSTLLPGPLATLLLAEAGAEVVKVERPGRGDESRAYEPPWGGSSAYFALLNRGKKSIALDLKNPADQNRLQPLLARADVVVEQFRPGVMARLGCDYERVARFNSRVVYCSISGYGQTGPKRDQAGHDLNFIAESGLIALSMGDPAHPVIPPALVADIAGGAYPAVMNILLALRERESTGRGRHLDISMTDNLFTLMYWAVGSGFANGQWPRNGRDLVTGGTARYRLYPTKDGRVVAAAPIEEKFWSAFCDLIGLEPGLRDDTKNPGATVDRIAAIIASETADTWASRFSGTECCCSIVTDLKCAVDDPHFKARGIFDRRVMGDEGRTLPALPIPIDNGFRTPPGDPVSAPPLAAHNKEYLDESCARS